MTAHDTLTRADLLSCLELSKALTAELRTRRLFHTILHKVSELLKAEKWSLLLLEEETQQLKFEISVDLDLDTLSNIRLPLGKGVAGKVALEQKSLVVPDVRNCDFFASEVDHQTGFTTRSIICAPVIFGDRTLGVIEVVNPTNLDQRALALVELIADYTAIAVENACRYRHIEDLSIHDNLTGLYNTRYLYASLASLIESHSKAQEPVSLIFTDIDHFKAVVDTYGHLKGSQAIQELAATLRQALTEPAYAVAYAGDEFVVVLPGIDKPAAMAMAARLRDRIRRRVYLQDHGHNIHLSASFGVATFPDDADDVRTLLAVADRALFRVKETHKGGIDTR